MDARLLPSPSVDTRRSRRRTAGLPSSSVGEFDETADRFFPPVEGLFSNPHLRSLAARYGSGGTRRPRLAAARECFAASTR